MFSSGNFVILSRRLGIGGGRAAAGLQSIRDFQLWYDHVYESFLAHDACVISLANILA